MARRENKTTTYDPPDLPRGADLPIDELVAELEARFTLPEGGAPRVKAWLASLPEGHLVFDQLMVGWHYVRNVLRVRSPLSLSVQAVTPEEMRDEEPPYPAANIFIKRKKLLSVADWLEVNRTIREAIESPYIVQVH